MYDSIWHNSATVFAFIATAAAAAIAWLYAPSLCRRRIELNFKKACSLSRIDPIRRNKCETKYIMIEYCINDVVHSNSNFASAFALSFEFSCLDKKKFNIWRTRMILPKRIYGCMSLGISQSTIAKKIFKVLFSYIERCACSFTHEHIKKNFSDLNFKRYKNTKSNG